MMEREPYPEGEYLLPHAAPTTEWVRSAPETESEPEPETETEPAPEPIMAQVFAALLVGGVVLGTLLLAVCPV